MKCLTIQNDCRTAMVDDEDYSVVDRHKWYVTASRVYTPLSEAKSTGAISLARFVMGPAGKNRVWDHEDRNFLNNCKYNLVAKTYSQNNLNRVRKYIGPLLKNKSFFSPFAKKMRAQEYRDSFK